jgi:hypothetical protein
MTSRQLLGSPPTSSAERDPMSVIEQTVVSLRQLFSTAPAKALHSSPSDDSWTAALIAAHLYDVDLVFGYNLRLALTEQHPQYVNYHEANWALLPRLPFWQTLNAWESLRAGNLILMHHLVRTERSRDGDSTQSDADDLICELAAHDLGHIADTERVLADGLMK